MVNIRGLGRKPGDPETQWYLNVADGLKSLAGAIGDVYDKLLERAFMRLSYVTLLASLAMPIALGGQQAALAVTTENGTALETRGKEQLERIVQEYDIDRWLFTKKVVIESRVIPHSHPRTHDQHALRQRRRVAALNLFARAVSLVRRVKT